MNRLAIGAAIALLAVPALAGPRWVSRDHWAYDAMRTLMDLGVATGYPDDTFSGNRLLTRYEFAAAVGRALDAPAPTPRAPGPAGGERALDLEQIAAILARLEAAMKGPKVIAWPEHRIGLPGHLDAEYDAYLTAATGIPHQVTGDASAGPR